MANFWSFSLWNMTVKLVKKFEEGKEEDGHVQVRPGRLVQNLYQEALEVSAAL